jgi:hypothetical protein
MVRVDHRLCNRHGPLTAGLSPSELIFEWRLHGADGRLTNGLLAFPGRLVDKDGQDHDCAGRDELPEGRHIH